MPLSFRHIVFGPVQSRRLGTSLGINLLPKEHKVCSFDCIYCECGLGSRLSFFDKMPSREAVAEALREKLTEYKENRTQVDSITFSGNGEPTLHPDFHGIIDDTIALRDELLPETKITVFSNATTTRTESVLKALTKVDNPVLKLDSAVEATVQLINQPKSSAFCLKQLVDGLKQFEGKLIVQTLFIRGEYKGNTIDNTTEPEIEAWLAALSEIRPRLLMIYSLDRETPVKTIRKIEKDELNAIAQRAQALGIAVSVR